MGDIWLMGMADWFRAEGCRVKEWAGWQRRSASRGGFINLMGVVEHHTASPPSSHGPGDWRYSTYSSTAAPEYNVGIDPDGLVNVLCAGGVNSTGRGGPVRLSSGKVPQDGANYRLVAISYGNNGVGEVYSRAMIDAGVRATAAILRHQRLDANAVTAHKEWCGPGTSAPGRKIDPYGPWQQGGDWGPRQGRIDSFRNLVASYLGAQPKPPTPGPGPGPSPKEDQDVAMLITAPDDPAHMMFAYNCIGINWLTSQAQIDVGKMTGVLQTESDGDPIRNFNKAAIQDMINRCWAGRGNAFPPGYTRPPAA